MKNMRNSTFVLSLVSLLPSVGCNLIGSKNSSDTPSSTCDILVSSMHLQQQNDQHLGYARKPVLDSTNVYWFEFDSSQGNTGGSIKTVQKAGGTVSTLASSLGGVNDLVSDGTNVYWTEFDLSTLAGSVKAVPKVGGTVVVLASGTPQGSIFPVAPLGITFDSNRVYWGEEANGGAIRSVPKAGGQVVDVVRGQGPVGWFALDSTSTYFYYDDGNTQGPGTFSRVPFGGGASQVLAQVSSVDPGGLDLDNSFVYWISPHTTSVFEIPVAGGIPTNLVNQSTFGGGSLAIDNSNVYFMASASNGSSGVSKIAKTGGTPTAYGNCIIEPHHPTMNMAEDVAVDDTNVYVIGQPWPGAGSDLSVGMLAKFPK
ncbi:MAG TPA: hypothetical protein VJP02_06865 [Candidatus Sulfotelmatobacter sp.]|nr:hypothetical protein [Candidatus Sulfotelmatobacter sp.]